MDIDRKASLMPLVWLATIPLISGMAGFASIRYGFAKDENSIAVAGVVVLLSLVALVLSGAVMGYLWLAQREARQGVDV